MNCNLTFRSCLKELPLYIYVIACNIYVSNSSNDPHAFARIVPKSPKEIGIITDFTLNCLLTSTAKSMYLSIYSSSFSFLYDDPLELQNPQCTTCFPPYQSLLHLAYYNSLSYYSFLVCLSYFAIVCLCYNIGYVAVPLIFCRDPKILE